MVHFIRYHNVIKYINPTNYLMHSPPQIVLLCMWYVILSLVYLVLQSAVAVSRMCFYLEF
jgi:hypothetical protein